MFNVIMYSIVSAALVLGASSISAEQREQSISSQLPKESIGKLITYLESNDWRYRAAGAARLSRYGSSAYKAVPALLGMLKDSNTTVRANAAGALGLSRAY